MTPHNKMDDPVAAVIDFCRSFVRAEIPVLEPALSSYLNGDIEGKDYKVVMRNQRREVSIVGHYTLKRNHVEGEVFDWILHHLEQKKCPYYLAVALASNVSRLCVSQLESGQEDQASPTKVSAALGIIASELFQTSLETLKTSCTNLINSSSGEVENFIHQFNQVSAFVTSICAIKNGRRKMEDRHMVIHDLNLVCHLNSPNKYSYYGVFDGHGGVEAATFVSSHLHRNLVSMDSFKDGNLKLALKEAFLETDNQFLERATENDLKSGTTVVVALKENQDRVLFAWAGDSQAILIKDGQTLDLTPPHKPEDVKERERIQDLGGRVIFADMWRVSGDLAVSRAIGDAKYKPYVTADPSIVEVKLDGDEDFMVLGCDGLWEEVTPDEATTIVYEHLANSSFNDVEEAATHIAKRLADEARGEGSTDNITTIVVFLKDIKDIIKKRSDPDINKLVSPESTSEYTFTTAKDSSFNDRSFHPSDSFDFAHSLSSSAIEAKRMTHPNIDEMFNFAESPITSPNPQENTMTFEEGISPFTPTTTTPTTGLTANEGTHDTLMDREHIDAGKYEEEATLMGMGVVSNITSELETQHQLLNEDNIFSPEGEGHLLNHFDRGLHNSNSVISEEIPSTIHLNNNMSSPIPLNGNNGYSEEASFNGDYVPATEQHLNQLVDPFGQQEDMEMHQHQHHSIQEEEVAASETDSDSDTDSVQEVVRPTLLDDANPMDDHDYEPDPMSDSALFLAQSNLPTFTAPTMQHVSASVSSPNDSPLPDSPNEISFHDSPLLVHSPTEDNLKGTNNMPSTMQEDPFQTEDSNLMFTKVPQMEHAMVMQEEPSTKVEQEDLEQLTFMQHEEIPPLHDIHQNGFSSHPLMDQQLGEGDLHQEPELDFVKSPNESFDLMAMGDGVPEETALSHVLSQLKVHDLEEVAIDHLHNLGTIEVTEETVEDHIQVTEVELPTVGFVSSTTMESEQHIVRGADLLDRSFLSPTSSTRNDISDDMLNISQQSMPISHMDNSASDINNFRLPDLVEQVASSEEGEKVPIHIKEVSKPVDLRTEINDAVSSSNMKVAASVVGATAAVAVGAAAVVAATTKPTASIPPTKQATAGAKKPIARTSQLANSAPKGPVAKTTVSKVLPTKTATERASLSRPPVPKAAAPRVPVQKVSIVPKAPITKAPVPKPAPLRAPVPKPAVSKAPVPKTGVTKAPLKAGDATGLSTNRVGLASRITAKPAVPKTAPVPRVSLVARVGVASKSSSALSSARTTTTDSSKAPVPKVSLTRAPISRPTAAKVSSPKAPLPRTQVTKGPSAAASKAFVPRVSTLRVSTIKSTLNGQTNGTNGSSTNRVKLTAPVNGKAPASTRESLSTRPGLKSKSTSSVPPAEATTAASTKEMTN